MLASLMVAEHMVRRTFSRPVGGAAEVAAEVAVLVFAVVGGEGRVGLTAD